MLKIQAHGWELGGSAHSLYFRLLTLDKYTPRFALKDLR